ncbi:tRNA (adenosine(37)-N6)-threonylcarbamoyltransferase complex ATPase subunit type 1 TsaE [Algiphilus sp.]|uniref:tRNA (adenosine(37)-N6)-threonylcarbamoyltransferase complex ATPase subunit type 1 TsaE n=1 Tax=Algiphilus sp. TaxID=1872431 RepID=UPI0025B809FC|nr:tRNA (adenosine(37)-N6)-threonylcarbamoyltransferase complex ATPase subunit type 1 TsaE [Algiphilus sp.]MCK5769606.1 tRNA (adenosine(37)-N6)-threonylcarbamoyltransferase complex ATPase subunit type 1 TsaE [Algiphilus sp.]
MSDTAGEATQRRHLGDEAATQALGGAIAAVWTRPLAGVIWLQGDLGAGKSTLARAFLRALGVTGAVRSPTYTLVEPYRTDAGAVLHMDCYRLGGPDELAMLGLRDTPPSDALWLVEWPERAADALPPADLMVALGTSGSGREAVLRAPENGLLDAILHSMPE